MVSGSNHVFEYIKESNYGVTPDNPIMKILGYQSGYNANLEHEIKDKDYLPDNASTDAFGNTLSRAVGTDLTGGVKFTPVDLTWLNDLMYSIGPAIPFTVGEIKKASTKIYTKYMGCVIKDFNLSIPNNDYAEVSANFWAADGTDPSETDYVSGTGTHASNPTALALSDDEFTGLTFNGSNVEGIDLNLSVDYTLKRNTDPNSTAITKTVDIEVLKRAITASFNLEDESSVVRSAVRNKTKANLVITFGGQDITLIGVGFVGWGKEVNAGSDVTIPVNTTKATGITVAAHV